MRYKDLLSEKQFLKVAQRARALMKDGTNLSAILYSEHELIFNTYSGTYGKSVIWTQRISITDALLENIQSGKSFSDIEKLIKDSDLKVDCTCPAFTYYGFKYKAWRMGYGLERETRRPVIKNPFERGFVCKHLYLVLQLYPFWSKALASKFHNWAVSKEGAQVNQNMGNLARTRMNITNQKFVSQLSNPSGAPVQGNVTTTYNQTSTPQQVSISDLPE